MFIKPNVTLLIPQQSAGVKTDLMGNLVPVSLPPIEVRAWLHEINLPKTEAAEGVQRDYRLLRGHTIGARPAGLATGQSIQVRFDNGVEGTLQVQDRILGDSSMGGLISGEQIQGIFKDNTQR